MIKELSLSISQLLGISTAISFLVAVCICALWNICFNRIKEGQKAEFQKQIEKQKSEFAKEIEDLKAKNEKINYITKTQFDAEFKMYQELSASLFDLFLKVSQLYPKSVMNDILNANLENLSEEVVTQAKYNNAINNLQIYQNQLKKYAPFIDETLFTQLDHFRVLTNSHIVIFKLDQIDKTTEADKKNEIKKDCINRTRQIEDDYENIIKEIRKYLRTLKVLDGKNE